MKRKLLDSKNIIIVFVCLLIGLICFKTNTVYAAEGAKELVGESFELDEEDAFQTSGKKSMNQLSFGSKSIGKFVLNGVEETGTFDGYIAYGASEKMSLSFVYDGSFKTNQKEEWNIAASDEKIINDIELDNKIGNGLIVLQSSVDGKNWETVEIIREIFNRREKERSGFLNITEDNLKAGTFYRVYIAYHMEKKVGETKNLKVLTQNVYEEKNYVEIYEFYVCKAKNPVSIIDLATGERAGKAVQKGFLINKEGTDFKVTIQKGNEPAKEIADLSTVTKPGAYKITVRSDLGKEYKINISVKQGINMTDLPLEVFEGDKKNNYDADIKVSGNTVFGMKSLSTVRLAHPADGTVTLAKKDGYDAYGISGDSVSLFLDLENSMELLKAGWKIGEDSYGKRENETIKGAWTGEVATGALIIQKSSNGKNWKQVDAGKYENGLYTTDFFNHYGEKGDICIYTPDGTDVKRGVYLRVLYAYEIEEVDGNECKNYLESYTFYLYNSELGAVTFPNMSVTDDMIRETLGEDEEVLFDLYKSAQTIESGAGTVTGFTIDAKKNPSVTVSVKHNGETVLLPNNRTYTEDGKYQIQVKSAVGDTRNVVIYIDKSDSETALKNYFGKGFLTGKRIYSEGDYPVYEAGKTEYHVNSVSSFYLPISGVIENKTTGTSIEISSTRKGVSGVLTEPGEYVATFTTEQKKNGESLNGDFRVFKFQFSLIAEGTAPGPVINQESLTSHGVSSMSDVYPMYYGLTYQASHSGNITLAFASREAAVEYAYNYEKGLVEEQEDGTYRYKGEASYIHEQKKVYDSKWELTDMLNEYAQQAVQVLYFDMTDPFTYLTMSDELLSKTDNIHQLEMNRSVVIFADGQREALKELAPGLPIINDKKYDYLSEGENGQVYDGYRTFQFVKDKYGIDSETVMITDCNEKEYKIAYQQSVEEQLRAQDCPSGVVKITEKTCYGDEVSYEAIYISENDNAGILELTYYVDRNENTATYTKEHSGEILQAEAFKINSLVDELDPYSIVSVKYGTKTYYAVADQEMNDVWSKPGIYTVSVINRLGYSYSIQVEVVESDYATLSFIGEGTEDVQSILVCKGDKGVKLPELDRYGYELVGYDDGEGTLYSEEISLIEFTGEIELKSVWKPRTFKVTLQDANGNIIGEKQARFGETCDLGILQVAEGQEFVGWMKDGKLLDDNVYKMETEGDVVVQASVNELYSESEVSIDEAHATKFPWISVLIFWVAVAGCAFGVLKVRNRRANADREKERGGNDE